MGICGFHGYKNIENIKAQLSNDGGFKMVAMIQRELYRFEMLYYSYDIEFN